MSSPLIANQAKPKQYSQKIGIPLLALFIVFAYGILAIGPNSTSIRTLSLVFTSIMLEAMPFMLFGSLVGGLIEAFVSQERMVGMLSKRGWVTVLVAAGMIMGITTRTIHSGPRS